MAEMGASDDYVDKALAEANALPPEKQLLVWKNMGEPQKRAYLARTKPTIETIRENWKTWLGVDKTRQPAQAMQPTSAEPEIFDPTKTADKVAAEPKPLQIYRKLNTLKTPEERQTYLKSLPVAELQEFSTSPWGGTQ